MWKGLTAIAVWEVLMLGIAVVGVLSSESDSAVPPPSTYTITARVPRVMSVHVKVARRAPTRGGPSQIVNSNLDSGKV